MQTHTSKRWTIVVVAGLSLTACGIGGTTPADEDEYLVNVGMTGLGPTRDDALDVGYAVCEDFRAGVTLSQEISALAAAGMSTGQAMVVATSAGAHLCPDDAPDLDS
jgi:hypothetical protein